MRHRSLPYKQSLLQIFQRFSTIGTAILTRWLGSAIQFFLNVVLGRVLGPEGLGMYYLFYAWARFVGQVNSLGLPSYALRAVTVMRTQDETSKIRPFLTRSVLLVLSSGTFLLLLSLPFSRQLAHLFLGSSNLVNMLILAVTAGTLFALLGLFAEALKAFHQAELALTLEFSAFPALLLLTVIAAVPFVTSVPTIYVLVSTVIAILLVVLIAYKSLQQYLPAAQTKKVTGIFRNKSIATFWGFGLLSMLVANLPFLLLAHFADAEQIGEFGVAYRLVALSGTVSAALASKFSPQFAKHYAQGDVKRLTANFNKSQLYSAVVFTPILLAMVVFAKPLLMVFGQEFGSTSAVLFLQIMAVGQFVNSSTGLTAQFLNMVHREAVITWVLLAAVLLMFLAIFILGGRYGALGVAIAYSGTLALQNIAAFFFVKRVSYTLTTEKQMNFPDPWGNANGKKDVP